MNANAAARYPPDDIVVFGNPKERDILSDLENLWPDSSILAHVYGHWAHWPNTLNPVFANEILSVLLNRQNYCSECILELIDWMVEKGVQPVIHMFITFLNTRIDNINTLEVLGHFLEALGDLAPLAHLDRMWPSILEKACCVSVRPIEVIRLLIHWRRRGDPDPIDLDYLDCLTQAVNIGNPDLTAKLLQFFEGRLGELPFKPFVHVVSELVSGFWVHCEQSMDCMRALSAALPLTQKCAELMRAEYQRIKVLYAGKAPGFNANKLECEMEEVMATWP